ncbi:MAG: hypothetical protein LC754_13320 [Acidobacteria bacterium]|nr:hypothetical protein [Acidobacteriota bacterium]
MKRVLEIVGWLTAVLLLAFASHAVFARPASAHGSHAQQEQPNRARRAERREDLSPASIVREARTIYIRTTEHLDKKYLEYKLQKYRELDDWGLMIVQNESAADLVVTIDKTALNYVFQITDPRTSVVVTSGKAVAVNRLVAAEYLGKEIIRKIRDVRASSDRRPSRKRNQNRDSDGGDERSES